MQQSVSDIDPLESGRKMAWRADQYELIDFGAGRKLEAFGGILVDRPCPAALGSSRCLPDEWSKAELAFELQQANWEGNRDQVAWQVERDGIRWQLKTTPFGHLGLFPEQPSNWPWLGERLQASVVPQPRVLHLFAYTGGTTLFLASQKGAVVHVDASKPAVQWARSNAAASGLAEHAIRWIVEDAVLFVERELRRGNQYEMVVLDPPGFGHGPKGQRWELEHQIENLLTDCCRLLSEHAIGILMTGHSEEPEPERWLKRALERTNWDLRTKELSYHRSTINDRAERPLDFGYTIRWSPKAV